MWKTTFFFIAAVIVGLRASAQDQPCKCSQNQLCQCVSKGSGGLVWTAPSGNSHVHHMPVPVETLLKGMTYALKPEAERQAYLATLPSQDQQFILENSSTLMASVQNLQADHKLYRQEMQLKGTMTPQNKVLNKVAMPN